MHKPLTKEQSRFVADNHNLIYSLLYSMKLNIDEWYDVAAIGLCKAGATYEEESSKFSTWAFFIMKREILFEKRKLSASRREGEKSLVYYEALMNESQGNGNFLSCLPDERVDVEKEAIINVVYDDFKSTLKKDRDVKVIEMLTDGMTQSQIAKELKISQPQVSRIRKKLMIEFQDL